MVNFNPFTYPIRRATVDDLPAIRELFVSVVRNIGEKYYNQKQLIAWASRAGDDTRWTNAIHEQYFIVIKNKGRLVGFGSLKEKNYIDFLFVDNDFQNRGIASCLYQTLEQKARNADVSILRADVSKSAKPFFIKQGFVTKKENRILINGTVLINYCMEKRFQEDT